jgi:Trk K+ transport system NAD-binding subunit
VGCNPLSRLIARLYQEKGESVVLIDTDADACKLAEQDGFTAFVSSALDTDVLQKAGLATAGTFLAMTNNGEVNVVLAQRAVEEFQPPRVFAIFPGDDQSNTTNSPKVQQAFIPQIALKTWNRHISDNKIKLGETTLQPETLEEKRVHLKALVESGDFVPILLEREGRLLINQGLEDWQAGDRLIYLFHDPRATMVKRLSGSSSPPQRLNLEKIPLVEELPRVPKTEETMAKELRPSKKVAEELTKAGIDLTAPNAEVVDNPS